MEELFYKYELHSPKKEPLMFLVFINEENFKSTSFKDDFENSDDVIRFIKKLKAQHWRILNRKTKQELNEFLSLKIKL